MKNVTKTSILLLAFLCFTFTQIRAANVSVNLVDTKTIKVSITELDAPITAELRDEYNRVLLMKRTDKNEMHMLLNLSNLDAGDYTLEMKDSKVVLDLPITITSENVEVKERELRKFFSPKLEKESDELRVTLVTNDEENLYVNIENRKGELMLSDRIEGEKGLIGRRYKVPTGEYFVTVASKRYTMTESLSVE